MSGSPARFTLLALLLAASLAPAAADAQSVPARTLVDSLAARYARLDTFHFAGVMRTSTQQDTTQPPTTSEAPFVFAARGPGRVRSEVRNPGMPSVFVADGESLRVELPMWQQYLVRVLPPADKPGEFGGSLHPLRFLGALGDRLDSATDAGRDTVITATGSVACRRIALAYTPQQSGEATSAIARVIWVDEARLLVLRDSLTIRNSRTDGASMTAHQSIRFVTADAASGGDDGLYALAPEAGMRRVSRLAPPGSQGPELEGKPAPLFTLPALTGTTRVALKALRGKVVVLDFWATWCGPCRRWMPIVAKLERELRGRNVRFYGVNERDTPQQVREFLKTAGLAVPVLMDRDGAVGQLYGASSIPLTVVVGTDGKVSQVLLGLHPEEDLREALKAAGVTGV